MSENTEMYLITIAMLQTGEQPVPLPTLAQALAISPVSTNEMCRKLADRGLVHYQPYKGVMLTDIGQELAQKILCRRRLWEVFLVERLGFNAFEAETIACQLEHGTSDTLAERLSSFLDHPTLSPQNQPIPCSHLHTQNRPLQSLATWPPGKKGVVVNVAADEGTKEFLRHQGLMPGAPVEVLAGAETGAQLVRAGGQQVSLAKDLAVLVDVAPLNPPDNGQPDAIAA